MGVHTSEEVIHKEKNKHGIIKEISSVKGKNHESMMFLSKVKKMFQNGGSDCVKYC